MKRIIAEGHKRAEVRLFDESSVLIPFNMEQIKMITKLIRDRSPQDREILDEIHINMLRALFLMSDAQRSVSQD